jgi:branched-chain amino acid transport system permease protein
VPQFLKNYGIYLFTYWLVFIIATMGLNLTVGYAGQKSLGHAAFFGIGAYTVAILMKAGISFWIGAAAAALICFGGRPGAGLSGAAGADDLPGLRHAGLQHRAVAGDAQRGVADRRHLRHQQHRAPVAAGLSLDGNLAYYYFVLAWRW